MRSLGTVTSTAAQPNKSKFSPTVGPGSPVSNLNINDFSDATEVLNAVNLTKLKTDKQHRLEKETREEIKGMMSPSRDECSRVAIKGPTP